MSSVLPSSICMAFPLQSANICNFLLQRACTTWFPAAKGTGYHASSHIITSYVLKRNWKQANKKESCALFFVWAGRAGLKMPFLLNASLPDIFIESGCISSLEIIPPRHFLLIRMHFFNENHPSRTFPADQDAFLRWKSSLPEIFSRSGCISPLGIISPGNFQQIRMHFSAGNHPSRKFSANQDAFLRRKSSLPDIFIKSGCISPLEIIPLEIIPTKTISPPKKACPAYETGRVHSERNSTRKHRENK